MSVTFVLDYSHFTKWVLLTVLAQYIVHVRLGVSEREFCGQLIYSGIVSDYTKATNRNSPRRTDLSGMRRVSKFAVLDEHSYVRITWIALRRLARKTPPEADRINGVDLYLLRKLEYGYLFRR